MPPGDPTRRPWLRDPFTYAAALCVACTLAFPGDIGWVNDEPAFLLAAHAANGQGKLASQVLRGSLGGIHDGEDPRDARLHVTATPPSGR